MSTLGLERITVHRNRHFLMTETGQPFFWLADTAWELLHRCTRAEAELYLENRRRKGFTVIQTVALAEIDGLHTPNAEGNLPLMDADPTRPNEAYFRLVDAVVEMAANKGMYIALLPTWGDKVYPAWGMGPRIFNADNARIYGRWLAERYRYQTNILWCLGGDRPEQDAQAGTDYTPVWRGMAQGIRDVLERTAFITYHPGGGRGSSAAFHHESWLDMNMWQSGHMQPDTPNWNMIGGDYQLVPTKPVLDGEPCYEDHPINPFTRQWQPEHGYFRDYEVRKAAYRAVFAGACGHTYGHHAVWQFYDVGREPINFPDRPWQQALDRPGAAQMRHLKQLMLARPYFNRIPAQEMIQSSQNDDPARHVRATCADDGSYAMLYIPHPNQSVAVNLKPLSGKRIRTWWYDPRTGDAYAHEEFEKMGTLFTISPAQGRDWVLVLDDAARGF